MESWLPLSCRSPQRRVPANDPAGVGLVFVRFEELPRAVRPLFTGYALAFVINAPSLLDREERKMSAKSSC